VTLSVPVTPPPPAQPAGDVMFRVENLVKHFPVRAGLFGSKDVVHAVDDVSFEVRRGEALGVVGESGSGKSTIANLMMLLERPTSGLIEFEGEDITRFSRKRGKEYRRRVQMVFQDTVGSLDPRMTVSDILGEPWRIQGSLSRSERQTRTRELLARVGLDPDHANRYPHQFSGGQRQRIGIARALTLQPDVVICDEPVSALDVSVQAQVLNLLKDLGDEFGLTYIFIAHDLSVVRQIADRVAVMYLGKVVEVGDEEQVLLRPSHPYTQALLSALPSPEREVEGHVGRIVLQGELPSPVHPPSGCRFRTRCWKAQPKCAEDVPELIDRGTGHPAACHFVDVPSDPATMSAR
jgi:oligopeptide transport system ATP-binding protein